jgi:type II secretory ATPase GspE/PulE/Tfp pilus assembly ATPase PilB-like protein
MAPLPVRLPFRDLGESLESRLRGCFSAPSLVRELLDACAAAGVTDIHLEAAGDVVHARARRAGELEGLCAMPAGAAARLVAALKGLAGCLPYRQDIVQEGRIPRAGVAADVRASFLPTPLGERVVLRLFGRLLELEHLGFSPRLLGAFAALLAEKSGLILVAGSSGAGKTTTLYAALAHLARVRGGAHLSIESPVEQRLRKAGVPVDQVELAPQRGLTAEAALAAALRQDVDVLSVGEIRTRGEAAIAVEAAHTGRLVLAGIHSGSCAEAKQRLFDLGVEPALLASTLRGVVWQSLETEPCLCGALPDCDTCLGSGRLRRPAAVIEVAASARGLACVG